MIEEMVLDWRVACGQRIVACTIRSNYVQITDASPWKVPELLVDLSLLEKSKEEYIGGECYIK